MKNFLVHNDDVKAEMLETAGLKKIEDLFKQIPQSVRADGLDLEAAISELEAQQKLKRLAKEFDISYNTLEKKFAVNL